ncbi:MAG: CoA transferase [SAR202 cluster bacterium]|nr:CoA transferase [SAR202 cluster bacterium]
MSSALNNIKVVDLTRTLAGPFCTMMLADLGAEVIKIEEPNRGDETRMWTPFWNGESTQFVSFNRNKKSLTVNLKSEEGVELVKKLAMDADIMIESFRAGALDNMGLGYDDIKKINPEIIYCSISGYGRTGPLKDMPGYDLIIQAYSGLMDLTGDSDGDPQRVGFSLVDLFTGMMAYGSLMTSLYHKQNTGKGQYVEAALLDGQVAAMSYHATNFIGTNNIPQRLGSGHPSLVPYQNFRAKDGYLLVGCANQGLWEKLCIAISREDLLSDPRFSTNDDRVAHRKECVDLLNSIFQEQNSEHWIQVISNAGVPCGPINNVKEVVENEQVLARNMIVDIPGHPNVPNLRTPNSPLKLSLTPPQIKMPPPLLGQHNKEVLKGMGLSESEITELTDKGVIGVPAKPRE